MVALVEWLRRVLAKQMGFPRESSNLSGGLALAERLRRVPAKYMGFPRGNSKLSILSMHFIISDMNLDINFLEKRAVK
nr:transmembrane protein, putative [Ipomoea trifida]